MPSNDPTVKRNTIAPKHYTGSDQLGGGSSSNSSNSTSSTGVVVPFAADVASGLGIEINTAGAAILATNRIDGFAAVAGKDGESSEITNTGTVDVPDATFDIGKIVWFYPGQTPNTTTALPLESDTINQAVGVAIEQKKILINIQRERIRS